MPSEESAAAYEIAHVLFVDIVGYSLQPIDRQTELLTLLEKIVQETAEFRRARDQNELISLPTGDGMALVFLRDPLSPVKCALQIANLQQSYTALSLRMGIHAGPVQRRADIREQVNVVGGGINTAQRVMDCGDAGHILLSRNVAEVLEQFSDWKECLHDLGVHEVKHGVTIHLYSLVKAPVGNPGIPSKLIAEARRRRFALGSNARRWFASNRKEILRRVMLLASVFLFACVVAFPFEQWMDFRIGLGESTSAAAKASFAFNTLYQRIAAAPRNPIPRYTVVVEIDPERDPGSIGLLDLCRQRRMMAVLIRRIADALPSVIVIDKFYGESRCPGDINPTLIAAFSEVSAKLPIVVGRRIVDNTYLQSSLLSGVPGIHDAIMNIPDQDERTLPLKWQIFPSKADMESNSGLAWRETLALKAAQIYEKGKLEAEHPYLAKLLNSAPNPLYISFLDPVQFKPYRFLAGFVLCGREVRPGEDATACPGSPSELTGLRGKIVVIGEITDLDMVTTVVGRMPGVYLQANFIEALMDDRYYEGFPAGNYVIGILLLASMETILWIFRNSWAKRLGAVVLFVLAMLFLPYIVITDFHRYVNPVPFVAFVLLLRGLAGYLEDFREKAWRSP